jgi:hypothetical protein
MNFDDLDDDIEQCDDGMAFENTVRHFGERLIDHWFAYRTKHWPEMEDRDFLPVLDGVREVLGELLSPDGLRELWDYACWMYFEDCKTRDPGIKERACTAMLAECLPEWHRIAGEVKPPSRSPGRRKRKGKQ